MILTFDKNIDEQHVHQEPIHLLVNLLVNLMKKKKNLDVYPRRNSLPAQSEEDVNRALQDNKMQVLDHQIQLCLSRHRLFEHHQVQYRLLLYQPLF